MNASIKIVVLFGLILIFGCIQQADNSTEKGFLAGRITIGPLCPVERNPPDKSCQPTEETYEAWQLAVFTKDRKTEVASIHPDLNGSYKLELPAGEYIIDFEDPELSAIGRSNLPANISIIPRETTNLDIDIDTGIR